MELFRYTNAQIIEQALDYYKRGLVLEVDQISEHEFRGSVSGSGDQPYNVDINIEDAYASKCSCPYSEEGKICKHMVALAFAGIPEKADEYEYKLKNYPYNLYDDRSIIRRYNYYDDELSEVGCETIYYNELLDDFINSLTDNEIKKLLKSELNKNHKSTFENYLQPRYRDFIDKKGNVFEMIDKLNSRIIQLKDIQYNLIDYGRTIIRDDEKSMILNMWDDPNHCSVLNKIFMQETLSIYDDYQWVAIGLKNHLTDDQRKIFVNRLENKLIDFKGGTYSKSTPITNILKTIYLLGDFSIDIIAEMMIINLKYDDFIQYIYANTDDKRALYKAFKTRINRNPRYNTKYIPKILNDFYKMLQDQDILYEYYVYQFLNNPKASTLKQLEKHGVLTTYIEKIEELTNNTRHLVVLYRYTKDVDKLYNHLFNRNIEKEIINNADFLCQKYENELKDYFINGFYSALTGEKKRKIYHEASKYIKELIKLKHGDAYVDQIIKKLQKSQYANCPAFFEEIDLAAGRKVKKKRNDYQ